MNYVVKFCTYEQNGIASRIFNILNSKSTQRDASYKKKRFPIYDPSKFAGNF